MPGCESDEPYEGAFDVPVAVAVLHPDQGGPFTEPVGFVASGHGGQIPLLALKQGRFLTDDPTVSFLRGTTLTTGGNRLLSSIAAWAPATDDVAVWAGDRAYEKLLYVPWVVGLEEDGSPLEGWRCDVERYDCAADTIFEGPKHTPPVCENEGVPCSVILKDLELKRGYTTTETWRLTWRPDAGDWLVEGSRSGRQEHTAVPGEPYKASKRRVAFVVQGRGAPGDVVRFATDAGVREYDVGGTPQQLLMLPDASLLAVVVHDRQTDRPALRWFDPLLRSVTGEVVLPGNAHPGRLALAEDGSALFVADNVRPSAWEIPLAPIGEAIEHPLPWPVSDVAPLFSDDFGRLLYVAPLGANEVWILDLDTDTFRDINVSAPGVQGLRLESPVLGIEALPLHHLWRAVNNFGVRESGRSVAVATHEGRVVFMEEGHGCLVKDELGPRTELTSSLGSSADIESNFDDLTATGPIMEQNGQNSRHVIVNPCAGIARNETWTVTFDRNVAAWRVDASITGEQVSTAFEDQRYHSDLGEVSFVVRAGATPTEDGWRMQFSVREGALSADGDNDRDGNRENPIDVPGDPVFFHYRVGLRQFGFPIQREHFTGEPPAWMEVDDRAFVLVPGQASNTVGRVNPQEAAVEVIWN